MKEYQLECLDLKQIEFLGADLPEEENKYITETAGFIPLEVKLKRFQENGQIAQFSSSEFTSSDIRDLYLSPELEITPDMDYEEILDVQIKRSEFIKNLLEEKTRSKAPEDVSSGAAAAGTQKEDVQNSEEEPDKKA